MNNVSTTSCPKMVYFILVYRTVIAGKERTKFKLPKSRHEFRVWTLVCVEEYTVYLKLCSLVVILLFTVSCNHSVHYCHACGWE